VDKVSKGQRQGKAVKEKRGFGSIRQSRSGRLEARYTGPDGQVHTAGQTFKTRQLAERFLALMQAEINKGGWVDAKAGKVTLADYAREWLDRRTDLRPTTRAKYAHLLNRHILPALGTTALGRIMPSAVRAWYLTLRGKHPTTADDAYRLLRAVLATAVADDVLAVSPCKVKGAGQVRSPERPTASVAELGAAVAAAPERYRLALLLPAWCQLRRGEVLGLQRRDVDLLHATVRVERAWTAPMGGAPVLGSPKTEKGTRTLTVPANVVPALADHLARFTGPEPSDWLFGGEDGQPISPRTLNRVWATARRSIGRPDLHLHDLRHSGLTWAAATGASVAELMRRGGHATPGAALRYQHATEDRDAAMAAALAAMDRKAPVVSLDGTVSGAGLARPGENQVP